MRDSRPRIISEGQRHYHPNTDSIMTKILLAGFLLLGLLGQAWGLDIDSTEVNETPGRGSVIAGGMLLGMSGLLAAAAAGGYEDRRHHQGYSRSAAIDEGALPWLSGAAIACTFSIPLLVNGIRKLRSGKTPSPAVSNGPRDGAAGVSDTSDESSKGLRIRAMPKE